MRSTSSMLMLLCAVAFTPCAQSQTPRNIRAELTIPDSGQAQILKLRDGSTLMGRAVEVRADDVVFASTVGRLTIALDRIESVQLVASTAIRRGRYWFPNPTSSRLFIGPTGRTLRAGDGYFSVHELLFPALNFGVTDRLTIGGGISLFPCSGECSQFGYVTPKLGLYSSENVQVATGVAVVTGLGDLDGTGGIVYGVSTFGSPDNSVSVGAGYGFSSDDVFDQPLAMLGGDFRFARRASFVTENYLVPFGDNGDYTLVVSYGVRLFGDRLSVDLGFFNLIEEPLFPGLPLLGFAFHF